MKKVCFWTNSLLFATLSGRDTSTHDFLDIFLDEDPEGLQKTQRGSFQQKRKVYFA